MRNEGWAPPYQIKNSETVGFIVKMRLQPPPIIPHSSFLIPHLIRAIN